MSKKDQDEKDDTSKRLMGDEALIARIVDRIDAVDQCMDSRFTHIDNRLGLIDQTVLRNVMSLEEHMRRTDLLEQAVRAMESRITPMEKTKIEEDAVKRHKHETLVRWAKIIATVATVIALLAGAKPLLLKLIAL